MKIGIPKEVKDHEGRVAITPSNVRRLVDQGHEVLIEANAGLGSGFSNEEYIASGGVLGRVEEAWDRDLVLKVKEPLESEYRYLNEQILFTFLHLSGVPKSLTEALLSRNTTGCRGCLETRRSCRLRGDRVASETIITRVCGG